MRAATYPDDVGSEVQASVAETLKLSAGDGTVEMDRLADLATDILSPIALRRTGGSNDKPRRPARLGGDGLPDRVSEVFGAVRGSLRLHWTQRGAREEAEQWVGEMDPPPRIIRWETLDDLMAIGRIDGHAVVIRSILLPLGDPPRSEA
jgi:hypothetical protein